MAKLSLSPNSASNKHTQHKLSLNKETLASLGERDLQNAHGGGTIAIPVTGIIVTTVIVVGTVVVCGPIVHSLVAGCIRVPELLPPTPWLNPPAPPPKPPDDKGSGPYCGWSKANNCTDGCVSVFVYGPNCNNNGGVGYA